MSQNKTLKGHCMQCDGLLEFPAESTGLTVDCPLCGQPTELLLARPVEEPTIPRKTIIWTLIAVLVMAGGLVGAIAALKRVERWAKRNKQTMAPAATTTTASPLALTNPPTPDELAAKADFQLSTIALEKVPGGSLVYAVGSVTNGSARQRFGVKVELDLLDAKGRKIGTASDYQAVIEARGQWQFKALVVDPKFTASAQLKAISEQE
jgi:hypothetical protein